MTQIDDRRPLLNNPNEDPNEISDLISINNQEDDFARSNLTFKERINNLILKLSSKTYVTVFILTCINLLNYIDRFSVAGVLPEVQKFYSINNTQAGLMTTSFILSYMCVSILFGYLGDRWNRKLIIICGIVFWGVVSLASSFISREHFVSFLILRSLIGVGEASYSTIAPTIFADLFKGNQRTKVLTIFYFAIPVGSGLGYILGSKVSEFMGAWQWALRITPFFCFLFAMLVGLLVYEPTRGASDHSTYLETTSWSADVFYLLKHKSFILVTLGFTCVSFTTGALALWAPLYIYFSNLAHNIHSISSNVSSLFGLITCVSGIVGVLLGSGMATLLRGKVESIDSFICGFGVLSSSPFLFLALATSKFNEITTYFLIFITETFLFLNWALVSDMIMYLIIPTRRSTAASFHILISHALGDAGSPTLIGWVSDMIKNSLDIPTSPTTSDPTSSFSTSFSPISTFSFISSPAVSLSSLPPSVKSQNFHFQVDLFANKSTLTSTLSTFSPSPFSIFPHSRSLFSSFLSKFFPPSISLPSSSLSQSSIFTSSLLSLSSSVEIYNKYLSLQYSLYITCFVCVIGGFFFLLASLFLNKDKINTYNLSRNYEIMPENENDLPSV